jgi:maltose alpha-D-glucosyltransferase/alpha-amylase
MNSWLKDAIIYQIYPLSFYDSNNDGIGDLKGVISKLDYIRDLGVNAVWINPFYPSSCYDGGYDVTDYYNIDKRLGNMEDFLHLIKKCNEYGIKIIIDLVLGHTSFKHPWFLKSAEYERNEYSNYYIWTDSIFCKYKDKTIHGLFERDGGYYANYYASQPALNFGFNNIEIEDGDEYTSSKSWIMHYTDERLTPLREEIIKIIEFWLDKGVDGIRCDMANSLVKGCIYNSDNDKDIEGLKWVWDKIFAVIRPKYPDRVFIAEWIYPLNSVGKCDFDLDFFSHDTQEYNSLFRNEKNSNLLPSFEKGDNYFSENGKGDINGFIDLCNKIYPKIKGKGYFSVPSGSHDQIRLAKNKTHEVLKTIYAFLLTFKHVPVIYYGDEIGMTHYDNINKEGGYIRTGARTPYQWDNGKNRGFSQNDNIYLPVNNYDSQSLESQIDNKNSLFSLVKRLIDLRKKYKCLNAEGNINIISACYPLIYERYNENEKIIICINPEDKEFVLKDYTEKKILLGVNYKNSNDLILCYGGILIFLDN